MAKQVKNSDLVQPKLWDETVKETEAFIIVLNKLKKSFKGISAESAKSSKGANPGSAKGIKDINEATELLKKTSIETDKVRAQIAKAEAQRTKSAVAASKQRAAQEENALRKREKAATDLIRQRKAAEAATKREAAQVARLAKQKEKEAIATAKATAKTLEGNRAYVKASAKLNTLRKRFKDLSISGKGTTSQMRKLSVQIAFLDGKLKKVDKSVGQSQRNVGNYSSAFKGLGGGIGSAIGPMIGITAAIAGITAGLRAATGLFREFGLVSAKVQAVSGATAEEFEVLQTQAMELGRVTPFTASNVAELQLELSKLGLTAKEIGDSTEGILNFGIATDSALGQAGKTVASTINAFELLASDSGKVADVLTKAFSSSALNLEKFDTALGIVGATANLAGLSLEETTAILGTLVDAGVDASKAATGLRKVLAISANENRNYKDVLAEIVGDTNQLSKANELFGLTAQSQAALIAKNIDKVDALTVSLQNAGGASKEAADIIGDTLDGDIKRLTSAIQGATLENKGFEDVLRDIIQFLTKAVPPVFNFLVNLFKVLLPLMKPVLIAFEVLADGIRGVTDAIGLSTKEIDSFIKATEDAKQANEDFENQLQSEFITLNSLKDRITDVNTSQEERASLIKLVNTEYSEYLPSLLSEEDSLERIAEKMDLVTSAMLKRQILMREEEKIAEALAKQIDDQIEIVGFQKEDQKELNRLLKEQIQLTELRNELAKKFGTFDEDLGIRVFEEINTERVDALSKSLNILTGTNYELGIEVIDEKLEGVESSIDLTRESLKGLNDLLDNSGKFSAIDAIKDQFDALLATFGLIREELKKDDDDEPDKGGKGGKELTQADILAAAKLSIEEQFQKNKLQLLEESDKKIRIVKDNTLLTDVERQSQVEAIQKEQARLLNEIEIDRLQDLIKARGEILKKDDNEQIKLRQELQEKLTGVTIEGLEERSDAEIKALKEHNKEIETLQKEFDDKEAAKQKQIQDSTVAALDVLDQAFAKASDNRINEIDREIQALQSREDALRQAAQNGSELAKDNLATNQRLQAEQDRIREEQVKKAQRREILLAGFKAYAQNAGDPGAVSKTLSDALKLYTGLNAILPSFYEGTEDTGTVANPLDSKGGRLTLTHDNERIVDKENNKKMGGVSNDYAAQIIHDHLNPSHFDHVPIVQVQRFESNAEVLHKFDILADKLDQLPKNMPRLVSENFDEKSKVYTTIIKTRNKVEKNHKKIGGAWG